MQHHVPGLCMSDSQAPKNPPQETPTASGGTSSRLGVGALLLLAVFVAYLPALSGAFIYDDLRLVRVNPNVQSLGAAIGAFFEPLWAFEDPTGQFQNAFWRPLTVITIALGRMLTGLEPEGYHWLSILLHGAATLAAWRFASRLLSSEALGAAVGLFFALHPVHVESVAWISAVNDPLHGLFVILSLSAHLAWRDRGSAGFSIASPLWLGLALLSKEQALVIPLIALALDATSGRSAGKSAPEGEDAMSRLARSYGGMLAVLLLYYAGRVIAYDGSLQAGFDQVAASFGLGGPGVSLEPGAFSLAAGRDLTFRLEIFGTFLLLLFAPLDLAVFRMVRVELPVGYTGLWMAGVASLIWLAALLTSIKRHARLGTGLLLALAASFALVVIRYESAGGFPISDRYLYVSVLLAGCLAAWALAARLSRETAAIVLGTLAIVMGARSFLYTRHFQNEERFFRQAVVASPDLPYVRWGLGRVLLDKYQRLQEREILDEAAFHFHMAQKLGTDYGQYEEQLADRLSPELPYLDRAKALGELINGTPAEGRKPDPTVTWTVMDRMQANMGIGWCTLFLAKISKSPDYDWPLTVFDSCVQLDPTDPRAHLGRGTVLMEMGRLDEAEEALSQAVSLDRSLAEAWHNLALCFERQKKFDQARNTYTEALRLRPGAIGDLVGLVQSSIDGRRFELAERHLAEAEELFPGNTELIYLRGVLLAARGDLSNALLRFDQVIAEMPDHPKAHVQRGGIFAAQGKTEDAMRSLTRACELMPESFIAHQSVAELLLGMNQADAALSYLRRSYALSPPNETRHAVHEQLLYIGGDDIELVMAMLAVDRARSDSLHALSFADRALGLAMADLSTPPERFAQLNYVRGQLLWQMDRVTEAVVAYSDCLRSEPDNFFTLHDLARIEAYELRDLDAAREYARRALSSIGAVTGVDPGLLTAMQKALEAIASSEPLMGPLPPTEDGSGDD